jgi:hypothetical protein
MNFNPSFGCESAVQVIFGCNGIITVPAPASGAQATHSKAPSTTAIDGGTPAQQALLHSIIDAMQPNTIDKIHIVASGRNIVLRMTPVSLRMTGVHSIRTYWEEALVAAAFRDRTNTGGPKLAVAVENGADRGVIAPGPASALPTARPEDAKAARQRFKGAAAKIGVSLDELTIYQPDGVAVAATLKSGDPAAFLAHQMPMFLAALGDRWRDYDGTYIRLVDDSRTTVWETSSTGRISSGSVGSRQDLAGCSPVANWGRTPPPCPAK